MARPVYWRQRYVGRSSRHRAYVRQEARREASLKADYERRLAAGELSRLERLARLLTAPFRRR